MRICYIANAMSIHTQRWVNHFAQSGHEAHLISARFPPAYGGYDGSIRMHHLTLLPPNTWKVSPPLSRLLWPLQIRRLLTEIGPDVLDAHFVATTGYLAIASGFRPCILTAWGSDLLLAPKLSIVHRFLVKWALKRADCVVCWSSVLEEEALKLGAVPGRTEVAFIGVDTDKFVPNREESSLRQELNVGDSSPLVISTRNLGPVYGMETLVKAVPLILDKVPETKFIVAGEGPLRENLETLAISLNVMNSIRFVGHVPYEKIPEHLASADVYVSTSLSDGTSASLLEAMSCGLAPVVTDIAANQPWVKDGEGGFLFPVGDHEMLAARTISLLEDDRLRNDFGRMSRQIVIDRASHEKQMSFVASIYERLSSARL